MRDAMSSMPMGLASAGPSMDYYIPQWEERLSLMHI